MPITTVTYFHSASLRQRYHDELNQALEGKRLQPDEHAWLRRLGQMSAEDSDPVRVDRITLVSDAIQPFELFTALMLSHGYTDNPRVYLYSLAHGIEVFEDRRQLSVTLRARFAGGDAGAPLEAEKIDEEPFRAQMLAIIEHQVERIGQLTAQLKLTTTLFEASTASLAHQLHEMLPHLSIDPQTHLLQIVAGTGNDAQALPSTQTLAQAAFDECCKLPLAQGVERRFLDAQGLVASAADAALFSQALTNAAAHVAEHYVRLLSAFWNQRWNGQHTRRDLAIDSFQNSLRTALHCRWHDDTLNADLLKLLLSVLRSQTGDLRLATDLRVSRLSVRTVDGAAHTFASTFIAQSATDTESALIWFTPEHRLLGFPSLPELTRFLATAAGRELLRPSLALPDQTVLDAAGPLQIELQEIRTGLFADRVDSVLALQARNLVYVMGLPRSAVIATSMIDDALDLRQLLDPRQLAFSAGRWRRDAPFSFSGVWLAPGPAAAGATQADDDMAVSESESAVRTALWLKLARTFDLRGDTLRRLDSVLTTAAESSLQQYLCVLVDGRIRAKDIRVQWFESAPVDPSDVELLPVPFGESQQTVSVDLVSLLLERVSGHRSRFLAVGAQVKLDASTSVDAAGMDLIEHMLNKAAANFIERYLQGFRESRVGFLRQGDRQLQPAWEALYLRHAAMRLDLALGERQGRIDRAAMLMAEQLLDRPVRSLRMALGVPVTDAFSVSLSYGDHPAFPLCDILLLAVAEVPDSPVMFWCATRGWQQHDSVQHVLDMLQHELHGADREHWLGFLGEHDRTLLRTHLLTAADDPLRIGLQRIDGHALEHLQQAVLSCQQQDLRQLCLRAQRCRFEAGLFTRFAGVIEPDSHLTDMLDGLSVRISSGIFQELLPSWLNAASLADLKRFHEIFRRLYLASDGGKDFLFGIPSLQAFARERLVNLLNRDFPGQRLNPDQITVSSRQYVNAFPAVGDLPSAVPAATLVHRESLVDYAINRFADNPDGALGVESVDQPQAVHLLTPRYLRQAVRQLDVGAGYGALLRSALSSQDADYAERKRLFVQQLPPAQLATALSEKIEGKLSAQAYAFVSQVFDMPDGLAREPLNGIRVVLSPLRLVADPGMTGDTVAGVYLICPTPPDTGPVILYAICQSRFALREYPSQQALMDDIRGDELLQQLLLERVDPQVRRRYAHGGFAEPHLPFSVGLGEVPMQAPGPVTVELEEVEGNALQLIFVDTIRLLVDMSVDSAVTNEQADLKTAAFLATLGLQQGLTLLPGKLAAMVTLWQSHTLLRASATSASAHRWGEALSEFAAALGMVSAAREQVIDEQSPNEPASSGSPLATGAEPDFPIASLWHGTALTAEQRARLQGLEAHGVALNGMDHDTSLNLFRDRNDQTPYAVVAGKLYQVRHLSDQGKWIIVRFDGTPGPQVVLDSDQRWQLDLSLRLRGGGGVVTRLKTSAALSAAEQGLIIEASGMSEIRMFYRDRAIAIGSAHSQASAYLQTCLDNLSAEPGAALDTRVTRLIGEFFGTDTPDQALLTQVEETVKTLLDAVMDASLSPVSSPRFVMGSNRSGRDHVSAFTIPADPQQRIFLTEHFFQVPAYRLKPEAAAQGFKPRVHYQAATLIHELSHLVLATKDIAYLEPVAPYPDLLRGDTAASLTLRSMVERLQEYRLSHRSAPNDLFKVEDDGRWRDLTRDDGLGFASILRITGAKTLDEARSVFLSDVHKRSRIMLKNADSVALLILRLGRTRYWTPNP